VLCVDEKQADETQEAGCAGRRGRRCCGGVADMEPFARVSLESVAVPMQVSSFSSPPPAGKSDVMAIIYSGDGGWADLDRRLGIAFIDRGIPVLGINTFKYYWRNRTADESAAELDALMTKYTAAWNKPAHLADRLFLRCRSAAHTRQQAQSRQSCAYHPDGVAGTEQRGQFRN
jgi:hypothetical protein